MKRFNIRSRMLYIYEGDILTKRISEEFIIQQYLIKINKKMKNIKKNT